MSKILTISIAAYNVEEYIKNTLDSLLIDNIDDLEILVEDDGGTDNTANIVKEYEEKYPGIVKLVHKENGGYGSTINKSIELAQGKYFKQLDGDDWFDSENFSKFLELLRKVDVDVVYTPYKEYFEGTEIYEVKDYLAKEIEGKYNLDDIILKVNRYLSMYTICYQTSLLKKSSIQLLEHCFYTDTQYAMFPIIEANNIYIFHEPLYVYRLGREGQSVSSEGMRKHYKDHEKVSKEIIKFCNKNEGLSKEKTEYLLKYSINHVANTIAGFYMVLAINKNTLQMIRDFEKYVYENNKIIYDRMNKQSKIVNLMRKTNYNYVVYKILAKLKIKKIEKRHSS